MVSYAAQKLLVKNIYDRLSVPGSAYVIRDFEELPFRNPEVGFRFGDSIPYEEYIGDVYANSNVPGYKVRGTRYKQQVIIRCTMSESVVGINESSDKLDWIVRTVHDSVLKDWDGILDDFDSGRIREAGIKVMNASFIRKEQRFQSKAIVLSLSNLKTWTFDQEGNKHPIEKITIRSRIVRPTETPTEPNYTTIEE